MSREPLLSVIIPTRNRERQLHRCLESLARQKYPRDHWEVVVVTDGGHPIDTSPWADRMQLRAITQAHAGCGIARNNGTRHARGSFVIFTDDDCLFPDDWLSKFADYVVRNDDCLIAGRSMNALRDDPYAQTTQDIMDYLQGGLNADRQNAQLAIGNNFGVPVAGFHELGGFSSRYFRETAEDRDFCFRWRESGRRVVYAPEIVVEHAHALSLRSFWRQHYRYGRGARLFHSSQGHAPGAPRPERTRFYVALLLRPFQIYRGKRAFTSFLLFVLSQIAQTTGYVSAMLSWSPRAVPKPGAEAHIDA